MFQFYQEEPDSNNSTVSFAHRRDTRIKEWSLVHGGFVVSAFENPNTELFISDFPWAQ